MGFKAYRMRINWTRIYPLGYEEKPNEEGLKFYDQVFDELLKYGIQPIVTFSYYKVPVGLTNKWNAWMDYLTIACYKEETASILKTITALYISKAFSLWRKISKNI